jgi:inosose dehydratase
MEVKLGHVAHTWGQIPLIDIVKEVSKIGYKGIEFFSKDISSFYDNPEEFNELLLSYGLVLSSLYYIGNCIDQTKRDHDLQEAARAADFVKALGASHLILSAASSEFKSDIDYKVMADILNQIGEMCLEKDVMMCFHPHVGSVIENKEEIQAIFEITNPELVFFCIDTGHIAKGGSDLIEITKKYIRRLYFVHLKDMKDDHFVELGRGSINLREIFSLLENADYKGWFLPEVPVSRATAPEPYTNAQISYEYLVRELGDSVIT